MDDELYLLAERIAKKRPSALVVRLWLTEFLLARPLPAPNFYLHWLDAKPISLDHKGLEEALRALKEAWAHENEFRTMIHSLASASPDCETCRQIAEMTAEVAIG